jgi:glycogen debranching enzyme
VTIEPLPTENDSQFRIAATEGIRERRTRILKHGDTFAVLNDFGDMTPDPGSPDGLYHRDTRFLSKLELRLNGHRPLLLSSTPVEDNSFLPVDLANTDSIGPGGISLHRDLIWLSRRQFVWRAAFSELLPFTEFRHTETCGNAHFSVCRRFRRHL